MEGEKVHLRRYSASLRPADGNSAKSGVPARSLEGVAASPYEEDDHRISIYRLVVVDQTQLCSNATEGDYDC